MHNTAPITFRSQEAAAAGGVVKGARTTATPRLTPERVMQRLSEVQHDTALKSFGAFYSSELGGIVTQPGFMVVHMDDHMVHKGDAVAESGACSGVDGTLQQFPAKS
ncbi:hypothetical protein OEZ86_001377 [Tetradesmus obliquus]|uniref:Uncharacterized protein n=1 Tax=Tetradesmus obliquus TaxID=3088 RepID=A0ABY8U8K7_TETOB|nr:hypothetical protein OEZ85_009216 [Tetradesmus obliquus]WIA38006.1 hypothetical protein OEZ86_001377 [Tetradesmus obliquus]